MSCQPVSWSFVFHSPDNWIMMLSSIAHKPPTSSHLRRNIWEPVICLLEENIMCDAGGGWQCFTFACFCLIGRVWINIRVTVGSSRVWWFCFIAEEASTRSPDPVQCMAMPRLMKIWLHTIKAGPISSMVMLTNGCFTIYYDDTNGMLHYLLN